MPDKCIRCGSPAAYPIRALEVRTLPVRGLGGERKVQALGDEKQDGVCEHCAQEQLKLSLDPVRAVKPQLIRFGAVFAAGLLIALKKAKEKAASLRALPEAEALQEAAWDVFIAEAPKKEDVNDLTYIPVNEKTRSRKNGDLMILYNLLPEIAVEAWKRLHPEDTEIP